MPSFVDSLRMNNIYPSGGGNPTFGPPVEATPNIDAIAQIMNLSRGAQVQNRDAEWNREDNLMAQNHANRLKEIAAAMGQQQQQEANKPMNVVMAPSGISPLDTAKLNLDKQKLSEKTQTDQANTGVKQKQADTSKQRADIYGFKATHPNMKIEGQKGGNFIAIDPLTGKSMDTGISTGTVSDDERIAVTGSQKLDEIQAKGDITKDVQNTRGQQQQANIMSRGEQARETKSTPSTISELPTQQFRDQMNKAHQIANTDQELGQFIKFDDKGNFTIAQPGVAGGPSLDQFARIKTGVYGSDAPKGDVNLDKTDSKKSSKAPTAPKGWKYVPKSGGGWTAVEDTSSDGNFSVADSTGIK